MSDKDSIKSAMSVASFSIVHAVLGFAQFMVWVVMAACVWLIL
jgi:hypothetical protein